MAEHIPRIDQEHTIYPAWVPVEDRQGNRLRPVIRCKCGSYMNCTNHHVHADGRLTNSWHDRDGCGWHVWLVLDNYDQGEFPPCR